VRRSTITGKGAPASRAGSKFITPAGAARLRAELDELWRRERPQVTAAVAAAAAQGDRSENAEYIYGKRRLPGDRGRVYFGARVTLADAHGVLRVHRVVGPDEFDMGVDYISMDSPLGQALLGRRQGEEVTLELARGPARYTIVAIEYG